MGDLLDVVKRHGYSRIPLWDRDPRRIVGVIFAKDLLAQRWSLNPPRTPRGLMRRPYFVPPYMRAEDLLEELRKRRTHMAVVVNEFGLAVGLCTMEDLLEEVFGPITDTAAERVADVGEAVEVQVVGDGQGSGRGRFGLGIRGPAAVSGFWEERSAQVRDARRNRAIRFLLGFLAKFHVLN